MLTCAAKLKKLWFVLEDIGSSSSKRKTHEDRDIDDKREAVIYYDYVD